MFRQALVFPTAPGRTVADIKSISAYFSAHMDEYRESRHHLRTAMERVYLQPTPMGHLVIAYVESEFDFVTYTQMLVASQLDVDRRFVEMVAEIHGVDIRKPPPGPPPQTIAEWVDPEITSRKKGLAFIAPVLPGKTEAAKDWAHEAFIVRRQELTESRRALGQDVEVVTLNPSPMGDFGAVYIEGNDPVEANRRFAASRSAYDVWFKDALSGLFPPEIDFNKPVPAVEQLFDYVAKPATA